ncbi:MAG: radical SAM protein [Bacteroidota bacterium]
MINRILLLDIDNFRDKNNLSTVYYSHHPIGLLYLVSAVRAQFPDIELRVFHTLTSDNPMQKIEWLIETFKPDLVGLRALSFAKESFKIIAEKIRHLCPDIPIVGGGPYASSSYNELLLSGLIELAVLGEGEATFVDLVGRFDHSNTLPTTVEGTAVVQASKVIVNAPRLPIQDVDTIAFPDYDFMDLNDYKGIKNHALQDASRSAFIMSSRGCRYACFYCHQLFGRKIRRRSSANVVEEMRQHIEKRGIYDFVFLDDIFNVPMPEAKALLGLIIKDLPPVRINFPNGLRADFIDEEMLELFEQAGTVEMALAVETVNPRLQKLIGKHLDIEKARKTIHEASKRFITRVFFMIGFPSETFEEAMETIHFAASFVYAAQPTLSVLRIYNNSKLFKLLDPTPEQALALATQEKKVIHLEMFDNIEFYGDLFSAEKVPLKSVDLKELLYCWMHDVLINQNRIVKSHSVLIKHLDLEKQLEFYRSVFGRPKFNENDLQKLLHYKE